MTTGDPLLDIVAGVFRQAVRDAKRGDAKAAHWLDTVAPDWRRYEEPKPPKRTKQAKRRAPAL